jgi:fimbrial isopeptide formation D2 family protein
LATDLLLTYNINFQNTGNAPAYNIVIEDTLSDKLDITTFNVLQTSHPYQLEVVNNQIIKWKFYNIMLPDSTTNEPASHGHINYQIRQKNGNQIGDVIKNKAYIYFDYNPPIITNETVNTIYQPTAIKNTTALRNQVVIYPNPASTEVYIDASEAFSQFTLYNQQMSIVNSQSFPSTKSKKVDISSLSNGIYFIKTNNGEMKKLVLQR